MDGFEWQTLKPEVVKGFAEIVNIEEEPVGIQWKSKDGIEGSEIFF